MQGLKNQNYRPNKLGNFCAEEVINLINQMLNTRRNNSAERISSDCGH